MTAETTERGDCAVASFDSFVRQPDFYSNIHAYYHRLRAADPVHWSDTYSSWIVTRYDDVALVSRDSDDYSSVGRVAKALNSVPEEHPGQLQPLRDHYAGGLISSDPPTHTHLRRLFNKPFVRPAIARMEARVEAIVDELVERMGDARRIDVISDFAYPVPMAVICDFLGIDIADRQSFFGWSHDLSDIIAGSRTTEGALRKQASLMELRAMIAEILRERRGSPGGEDMFSALIAAREGGDSLTEEEIIQSSVTLILGSHETTTNLIGSAMLNMIREPSERDKLRRRPELMESAVEEFLRYDSSLNHSSRIARRDLELRGRTIREGELVTASLVAADRDPERFAEPDRLDIERSDNRHVAFGLGPHFCLGAPLARLEGRIAIGALLRRYPHFELAAEPEWRPNLVQHGLVALELDV